MSPKLCVFGEADVHFEFQWVHLTQKIADADRNRAGHVATDIYVSVTAVDGNGDDIWCIDLNWETSKMYFDATSRIDLNKVPKFFERKEGDVEVEAESDGPQPSLSVHGLKEMVMAAAVVDGLSPDETKIYDCDVLQHVVGSSVGLAQTAISGVYAVFMIMVVICALFSWSRDWRRAPTTEDPLSQPALLEQIRLLQRERKTVEEDSEYRVSWNTHEFDNDDRDKSIFSENSKWPECNRMENSFNIGSKENNEEVFADNQDEGQTNDQYVVRLRWTGQKSFRIIVD